MPKLRTRRADSLPSPTPQGLGVYSGLPMSCTQTGVPEPAKYILKGHLSQRLAQDIMQFVLHPRLGPAERLLDLREHLLDRRVIRAVRRQRQDTRPRALDRRDHARGL